MPARRSTPSATSLLNHVAWFVLVLALGVAWAQDSPQAPPTPAQSAQPSAPASPQQPPAPAPSSSPQQANQPVPGTGIAVEPQPSAPTQSTQGKQQAPAPAGPITKQQAKELFRSVNEILQFASQDTGLPIRSEVKRKLITRQAVARYVQERMRDDKDTQRLERSLAVLTKFGLLPPHYDLHKEYLRLLQEQVAAFYDPRSKTVNLLDWVPPEQQKPVLAHELTHALQDQYIGLDKWELSGGKEDGSPLPDNQEAVVEEAQAAREALAEGQAMIVLLDYSLAPIGKSVVSAPDLVDAMRAGMGESTDSPIFAAAPTYLRESMLMPYTFGSEFVRKVLEQKGKTAAFAGLLDKPPANTRQIMEPETYLNNEVIEPVKVPDLDNLVGPGYERYDFGGIGEFDIYLLAKQYAPDKDAKEFYPHWRGGYYLTVHAKGGAKDQIGLLFVSRWDSPESAQDFSELYRSYVPKRYPQWFEHGTRPPSGGQGSGPGVNSLITWWEGPESDRVHVMQHGSDLLVLEGLDRATAERVSCALLQCGAAYGDNASPTTRSSRPN